MNYQNSEAKQFWEEKEIKYGAKVDYFTFATLLGASGSKIVRLGGLIYIIDGKICFEDFEKDNWFSKIVSKNRNYEKTEIEIDLNEIDYVKIISKSSAVRLITGLTNDNQIKTLKGIKRFLFQPIVQIKTASGKSYFFEIMQLNLLPGILLKKGINYKG